MSKLSGHGSRIKRKKRKEKNMQSKRSGPPFRYINQEDKVSNLVIVMKFLGDMKYFTRSVKRAADAVGIWT